MLRLMNMFNLNQSSTGDLLKLLCLGSIALLIYIVLKNPNLIKNDGVVDVDSEEQNLSMPVESVPTQDINNDNKNLFEIQNKKRESAVLGYSGASGPLANIDQAFKPFEPLDVPIANYTKDSLNAGELLPNLSDNTWSKINPSVVSQDLQKKNFLFVPGRHIGVNTVGQSNKNANMQLRSDPPIPRVIVSPWLNSSILDKDEQFRKKLEIGSSLGFEV